MSPCFLSQVHARVFFSSLGTYLNLLKVPTVLFFFTRSLFVFFLVL
jgi:hypothetical protein